MNGSSLSNKYFSGSSICRLRGLIVVIGLVTVGMIGYDLVTAKHYVLDGMLLVAVGALITAGFKLSSRVQDQMAEASQVAMDLAGGNLETRISNIREQGEFGELLHSLNEAFDRFDTYIRESSAAMKSIQEGRYYRKILMAGMVGEFERGAKMINKASDETAIRIDQFEQITDRFSQRTDELLGKFSSASTTLQTTADDLQKGSQRTTELATTVAAGAEEASANVETVAASAEEMTSSINEISEQVNHSSQIADDAVEMAGKTNDTIRSLSAAANQIGDIVQLINDIAEKTNLLALNATIEAARAGEAGRGFAVVASEVKALAKQTGEATDEISAQVKEIQLVTDDSVESVGHIRQIIEKINESVVNVSSAVEEQSAAMGEIARNVQEAAAGTREVTQNMGEVSSVAKQNGSAANDVKGAADTLSKQSTILTQEIKQVIGKLREAV
jgi:methyl-accepting chemotaxis protein